jgi:hypothetical protein
VSDWPGRSSSALARFATVLALTLITFLLHGYQYGTWPQLFPLEHILHLGGALRGDWYTSHAAPHWVFDHAAALIPDAARASVFAVLWVAGTALFWAGFAALASDLGLAEPAIFASGVIGARTMFSGFGDTSLLAPYLYPSNLACAAWMWALRETLRGRERVAGALVGVSVLVHPQIGLLALATLGCVTLRVASGRALRAGAGFATPALLVGGFALARLIADLRLREPISQAERFELLAQVRLPHHLVYRAFHAWDYAAVAVWTLVLLVALIALRGTGRTRGWGALLLASAALCVAGAFASSTGWPLVLVELQTARLSAWVPLLAILASATALATSRPTLGTLALFATPLLGEGLWRLVRPALAHGPLAGMSGEVAQALVLLALLVSPAFRAAATPRRAGRFGLLAPTAAALFILGFVASNWRHPPRAEMESEWREIAERARTLSGPTEVFATPPDMDGFRFYSRRPIVCDFGNIAHDDLVGWRERMNALTGDPAALDPALGLELGARIVRIASDYDRAVWRDPEILRRYGARFVVARAGTGPAPAWAVPIASNSKYVLFRIGSATQL